MSSKNNRKNNAQAIQAPKVVVEGIKETTELDGSMLTSTDKAIIENASAELQPIQETPVVVEEVVQEYTTESILAALNISDEAFAKRLAVRIANYCTVVANATEIEAFAPAANNMADVLNLTNKTTTPNFIAVLKGLTSFINKDRETFGAKSVFAGTRPHRPFLGTCPPACRFLESLLQLASFKTRRATIKRMDANAITKFLADDKKELFITFFKE